MYRIVRTDGAGCVTSVAGVVDNIVSATIQGGANHGLWSKANIILSDGKRESRLFVSTKGNVASLSTIITCRVLDGGKSIQWSAISPNSDNPDSGIVPFTWDLDSSGNLLAIGSSAKGFGGLKDGIFIYSINGPAGAVTDITKSLSDADRIPGDSSYFSVFWIK
jgi:hypothetical protein